ncbi:MAG: DUF2339 domain-containing protein [Loktanella sp.]|nr:DUF2339 domain-containing protein [Loktanella sp.]
MVTYCGGYLRQSGCGTALVATTAVAGGAILLGWFHGRVLAYGGVIGASISPLLVDGAPDSSGMLFYHQALIALTGAAVGAIRGWHGLTLTALAITSWMAWVIHLNLPLTGHMTVFVLMFFAIAVLVAGRSVMPRHDGNCASALLSREAGAPRAETLIAAAGAIFAAGSLFALGSVAGASGFTYSAAGAVLAAVTMIFIAPRAPALADLFASFALALIGMIVGQGLTGSDAVAVMLPQPQADIMVPPGEQIVTLTTAEIAFRSYVPALLPLIGLAMGAFLLFGYAWRPLLQRAAPFWAVFVPGVPVGIALALQSLWAPAMTFGDGPWFFIVAGLAAGLAGLVVPAARAEAGPGPVTGQVAAGSAVLIAHAFFILLSGAALTSALGALLVALAVLDRLYRLRGFALLIQAGTVLIGGRLLYDLSLDPVLHGSAGGALLAQTLPILLMGAAWALLDRDRAGARITLDNLNYFGNNTVSGPFLFDTLAAGYLTIALIFAAGAWFLTNTPRWFRGVLIVLSASHVPHQRRPFGPCLSHSVRLRHASSETTRPVHVSGLPATDAPCGHISVWPDLSHLPQPMPFPYLRALTPKGVCNAWGYRGSGST